jgi:hypothetical protein
VDRPGPCGTGRCAPRGLVLLYALRFILAAPETAKGLRRMVLDATYADRNGWRLCSGMQQPEPLPDPEPEAEAEL